MRELKEIIIEKLKINKESKSKSNLFVFQPKDCGHDEYSNKIDNLKISLPFNIIANNKITHNEKVTVEKIEYSYEYNFDSWYLFDKDNLKVIGLTSAGVYKLFIENETISDYFYEEDLTDITLDKDSCQIELS